MNGIIKGLRITFKHLFKKKFTIQYPKEKRDDIADGYRGALHILGTYGDTKVKPLDVLPPCVGTCPANTDAQGYIDLIRQKKYIEAYKLAREKCVMPASLGRVCQAPCETKCTGGFFDQPLAIRQLKRFISDEYTRRYPKEPKPKDIPEPTGKKIGIIGSGPSGLTAAYDLAKKGHKVTIFEKLDKPGGMLMAAIPKYRLPKDILMRDIENITALGVEIKTNVKIGKDVTFEQLNDHFDVVLIAVGLSDSRSLPIDGTGLKRVLLAIPFLTAANLDKEVDLGKNILVIGGGNVAIDVARTALRLSGGKVKMASLESKDEMPANAWEVEEAEEEGIEMHNCRGPQKVCGKTTAEGVDFITCTSVFDEEGRFSPTFNDKEKHLIDADTVIISIGQGGNLSFLKDSGIELNERGNLVVNQETFQTSNPKIFASGEIARGPGFAIQAVADGHNVATSIEMFLQGKNPAENRPKEPKTEEYDGPYEPVNVERLRKERLRVQMPILDVDKRVDNFDEVEVGFTEKMALDESGRCLTCYSQKCIGCQYCEIACPADALEVEVKENGKKEIIKHQCNIGRCTYCGICEEICPTKTLNHTKEYELSVFTREDMVYDKEKMLREDKES